MYVTYICVYMCVYAYVCYVIWYTSTLAEHACHRNNKLTKLPVPGTQNAPFKLLFRVAQVIPETI